LHSRGQQPEALRSLIEVLVWREAFVQAVPVLVLYDGLSKQSFSAFVREILDRTNVPSLTLSSVIARFKSPDIGRIFCQMFEGVQTLSRPFVESGNPEESLIRTI
jgi:hypothetical protein